MNMHVELESLVLAAARGDAEAYGELVSKTSPLVSSITLAVIRDLDLSREVAQDVFLAVWRDLKSLRNPASFLPWLRQTARNRAKTALRTGSRQRKLGASGMLDNLLPAVIDPRPNIADQLILEEELQALAEALTSLPEETREVLTLYYREGQSVAQVAALLEMSEVAVKKRLSRARASLRGNLQEKIGETLHRTTPAEAFTAGVLAALPPGGPAVAAAASLTASKIAGGAVWMSILKLLAPLSGVLAGGLGGVAGVILGSRKWLNDARDEREREALRTHRLVSSALVLLYAVALPAIVYWTNNPWWAMPWFFLFIATLAILQHAWLPRIVGRRMEAELRADPLWAGDRRLRERRQAVIGWTIGVLGGSLGLAVGLWSALHH
jgi:RNA polymerase sigma factor (sigma-70 family)